MSSFSGIFTPLITPLDAGGNLDPASLQRLVEFQVSQGVNGLWAMGTSSEFAAFDEGERADAIETTVGAVSGRVPVIANISDAATRLAIRHARRAQAAGADAIAATPPYYYPHSQDEVLAHYRHLRDAVDLPLFIYNIPQTVRVRVELPAARTLAEEGTAAGIKDSQNDLEWFRQLALFVRRNEIPFALFAGTRYLIDAAVLAGATGAIPSIANAFPDLCVTAFRCAAAGDYAAAAEAEGTIVSIESIAGLVPEGSRNAAILGFLKAVLYRRGIIATPALSAPLRNLTGDEIDRALARLDHVQPVVSGIT